MKKAMVVFALFFVAILKAQNYNNILNYNYNGTPTHGVKIKTNLPFIPASQMPTIRITGFNFGSAETIDLTIVYYTYSGGADFYNDANNFYFYSPKMSSSGSYTPRVYLSSENGKVVLFIDDKSYYQRFTVSAYAQGMAEVATWFQGWTAVDEPLSGVKTVEIPYQNRLKGNIYLSGSGVWDAQGKVGIGTTTPDEKLTVKGKIHTQEVRVDMAGPLVPDYVFAPDYDLKPLSEVAQYIKENRHLPEIPSAKEIEANGLHLAEMNMKLLKKIEELTLYVMQQDKKITAQGEKLEKLTRNQANKKRALRAKQTKK
nr:tail fiber protein [uncultured Flavobacterium sp.]